MTRQHAEQEQADRVTRADATIDRAGQVLVELLAVAGELEACVREIHARAAIPRPDPTSPLDRRPRRG